jgi:hypothetical protein
MITPCLFSTDGYEIYLQKLVISGGIFSTHNYDYYRGANTPDGAARIPVLTPCFRIYTGMSFTFQSDSLLHVFTAAKDVCCLKNIH